MMMPVHELAQLTWEEVRDLDRAHTLVVLPVGAIEAHGPHLPLDTDVVIATAMARAGAKKLAARGGGPRRAHSARPGLHRSQFRRSVPRHVVHFRDHRHRAHRRPGAQPVRPWLPAAGACECAPRPGTSDRAE